MIINYRRWLAAFFLGNFSDRSNIFLIGSPDKGCILTVLLLVAS
jgi:hypothetical protein